MSIIFHRPSKNFRQRLSYSILFVILVAALIFVSHLPLWGWLFVGGIAIVQNVALTEYVRLCRAKGFSPAASPLRIFSFIYLIAFSLYIALPQLSFLPPLLLFLGAICIPLIFLNRQQGAIANLSLTLFGFIYISFPLSLLVGINFLPLLPSGLSSTFWITWLLVTTKGSDVSAYLFGKLLGKHPLAPSLSPKKTIEGAAFGIIGASVLSLVLHNLYQPTPDLAISSWVIFGGVMGIAAMIGDLSESLLKRDAGVKDSNAIPGLGGVLDMIDSLIFASPLLFLYLKLASSFPV